MPGFPHDILCFYMYVQLLIHVKAIAYSCISNKPNVSCLVAWARETRHLHHETQ